MFYAYEKDVPQTQGNRPDDVFREICRPAQAVAGKEKVVRRRTRGEKRSFGSDDLQLGIRHQLPGKRKPSQRCRGSRNQAGNHHSRSLKRIFKKIANFGNFSLDNRQSWHIILSDVRGRSLRVSNVGSLTAIRPFHGRPTTVAL